MSSYYLLIFKKCPHATQTMSATAVCTISFGSVANRTKCTDIITSNEKQDGKNPDTTQQELCMVKLF